MSIDNILSRITHYAKEHPAKALQYGALGVAFALSMSPVALPLIGIGRQAQRTVQELCITFIDPETGNARGLLPPGPYGMAMEVYQKDEDLY